MEVEHVEELGELALTHQVQRTSKPEHSKQAFKPGQLKIWKLDVLEGAICVPPLFVSETV